MCGPNSGLSPSGHLPRNRIDVLMLTAMNLAWACLKMGYPYIHCSVIIPIKEYSIINHKKIKLMLIVLETNISDKNRPFRAVIRRIRGEHLSCNLAGFVHQHNCGGKREHHYQFHPFSISDQSIQSTTQQKLDLPSFHLISTRPTGASKAFRFFSAFFPTVGPFTTELVKRWQLRQVSNLAT